MPASVAANFTLRRRFDDMNFPLDSSAVVFSLAFQENTARHPVFSLRMEDLLPYNTGQYHQLSKRIPLGLVQGTRGRFTLDFVNLKPFISDVVVRRDSEGSEFTSNKPGGDGTGSVEEIPKTFALRQNYPNPFAEGITS